MLLHALRHIGTGTLSFEVHNHRTRLVVNALAHLTHTKGQISVFVIRRRIAFIEAAQQIPVIAPKQQAGTRAIVNLPQIIVFRQSSVFIASPIPRRAIAPHDATGFL